jgi:hypothetical protein
MFRMNLTKSNGFKSRDLSGRRIGPWREKRLEMAFPYVSHVKNPYPLKARVLQSTLNLSGFKKQTQTS